MGRLIEDVWGIGGDVNAGGQSTPVAPTTLSGWCILEKKFKKAIQTQAGPAMLRITMPLLLEISVYRVQPQGFCLLYTGIYRVIARGCGTEI